MFFSLLFPGLPVAELRRGMNPLGLDILLVHWHLPRRPPFCLSVLSVCSFFFFWLRWVFIAARGLSLVAASGGLLFVAVRGLLIAVASLVARDTGSRAQAQ